MKKITTTTALFLSMLAAAAGVAGADAGTTAPGRSLATSEQTQPMETAETGTAPSATPIDPGTEYLNAFTAVTGAFASDSTVGRVVGTAAGVAIGCPLGAVTGGSLTIAAPVLTPVGIVGGCILGAGALGFVGGTVGSIISGSPALVNALGQQYSSLHSKGLIAAPLPDSGTGSE
ncbi:hypothetical protein [Nocardia cerradoensis]|uniref:Uncharacterized protein n=1 Tax=Nocardia cerradoensis TaxID=85688 RepID=A0A231GVE8_9NOCA|nr:hypothetical protein [Nocardia cerradoensis]NKY43620.1 hypothetical protein [Nocardia cerradoensis]OXR40451.1 hypothetical protein B7C42_07509 [Nocardia cerradoensis]